MRTEGSERENEMDGFLIHAHFSFLGKCPQTISQYIVQESRERRETEEEEEEEEEEKAIYQTRWRKKKKKKKKKRLTRKTINRETYNSRKARDSVD